MTDPADYAWLDELGEAACVTVVAAATAAEVLARFGADISRSVGAEDAYGGDAAYVGAVDVPGGAVALEYNGYQGSLPEVLERVAGAGVAASMFWNVNAHNAFTWHGRGEAGRVDMYDAEYLDEDDIQVPDGTRDLFASAASEQADAWSIGMAMVEVFTGVAAPGDAVLALTTFYVIPGA